MSAAVQAITMLYRDLSKKERLRVVETLLADSPLGEDLLDIARIIATRREPTYSTSEIRAALRAGRRRP